MGPEDSEKKEVKVYMMVDGQPVEIAPEIAEIKLPEVQQGGDVLPLQECEITIDAHLTAPLIHGRMIYRCESCGSRQLMYLEKGIEEFGENHKPSPLLEPGEPLDVPTAWDRKEAREKQRAVERAASSRFRQYKARESAWAAEKRTGQRRREWRGPDRT